MCHWVIMLMSFLGKQSEEWRGGTIQSEWRESVAMFLIGMRFVINNAERDITPIEAGIQGQES